MAGGNYSWRGGFCLEVSSVPNTIVIFGASGDLAKRKLLPALYSLYSRKLFHEKSKIVGFSRTPMTDDEFREQTSDCLKSAHPKAPRSEINSFLEKLHYLSGNYDDFESFERLSERLNEIDCKDCISTGRIFYLSTPASIYLEIIRNLHESGLTNETRSGIPWRHVVLEKPFGHDFNSAVKLDSELKQLLREKQIYRIDHYLGKETVQNILMLRFANSIFEPVWNNTYIDNVQITVAESIGVEKRAGYYDNSGQLRDMFQNHMLEMLSLVTMEAPVSFDADNVRNEKAKLLKSIRPFALNKLNENIMRGQYSQGMVEGSPVPSYLEEEGIPSISNTETYVAAKFLIDNWRWRGVPFYMRTGKRLAKRVSEIAITFKKIPHSIFSPVRAEDLAPNTLILNVQPREGLALTIQAKQPGPKLCMGSLTMDFKYEDIIEGEKPEAYERLLLDCMLGDQTLFIRSDTIETAWSLLTPVLDAWGESPAKPETGYLYPYEAGSWGPKEADEILRRDGNFWREP